MYMYRIHPTPTMVPWQNYDDVSQVKEIRASEQDSNLNTGYEYIDKAVWYQEYQPYLLLMVAFHNVVMFYFQVCEETTVGRCMLSSSLRCLSTHGI